MTKHLREKRQTFECTKQLKIGQKNRSQNEECQFD